MLSPDQIEQRKLGITATDVAAIVGLHPWRSAIDVWRDKRGDGKPYDETRTMWGHTLEPLIRRDYADRNNVLVDVPGTLMHPDRPWMMASPDGIVYPTGNGGEPDRGMEIKVHNAEVMRWLAYGAPGTDEIPPWELIQDMWGMAVTGLGRWDHIVFDGSPTEYVIDRDEELIGMLTERADQFLTDYVKRDEPPPPDGSKAYDAWIASRFKANNAKGLLKPIDKDHPILVQVSALRETRAKFTELEKIEKQLEQAIKLEIGDAAGIEFPMGRGKQHITYKQPKDSVETNWEAAAVELRTYAQMTAQAVSPTVERARIALDKLAEEHFANTRATIRGVEIKDLVETMHAALVEIAKASTIAVNTKVVPNSRRFCVPNTWSKDNG